VVDRSIGNGEVDSSILSGSTSLEKPFKITINLGFHRIVGFGHFSYFRPEQTMKACVN
jgi:hypothetical protein